MNLFQYTERSRKKLPMPGIGFDPRDMIQELYDFFNEMEDLEPKWLQVVDPLTNRAYESNSAFKVLNRHTQQHTGITIQLEF